MAEAPAAETGNARPAEVAVLQSRKRDLYAAIHALTRDHEEGTIDDTAFLSARERFEREAAFILQQIDALGAGPAAVLGRARRGAWPVVLIALAVVAAAIVLFLVTSLHDRGTGTITGSQPGPAPTAVPNPVAAAQTQTRLHPRNVTAWLTLGNAYLDTGRPAAAESAFRTAIRLAPGQPEAPTLDALALAGENRLTPALQVLSGIERAHPAYARAWLTDGLIAARRTPGIPRAIRAWKRFLMLQPHGPISATIRTSLRKLEQVEGTQ